MALVAAAAIVFGHLRPRSDAERFATMGDDVREAVVRTMSGGDEHDPLYFLSFENGSDPSDAFLARIADARHRVRKGSQASWIKGVCRDPTSGEKGIAVSVTIGWVSDAEADVGVTFQRVEHVEYGYVAITRLTGRRWHVEHTVLEWSN
jgi:hypothetical protein